MIPLAVWPHDTAHELPTEGVILIGILLFATLYISMNMPGYLKYTTTMVWIFLPVILAITALFEFSLIIFWVAFLVHAIVLVFATALWAVYRP